MGGIERGLDDPEHADDVAGDQERGRQRRTTALDGNGQGDVERGGGEEVRRGVLDQVDRWKDVRIGPGALDDDRQRPQDEEQAEEAEDGRAGDAAGPREDQQTQPGGQDRGDAVGGDLEQLGQLVPPLSLRRAAAMDDTPRHPHAATMRGRL